MKSAKPSFPGPPLLIERVRTETLREVLEKVIEIAPDVVYQVAVELDTQPPDNIEHALEDDGERL